MVNGRVEVQGVRKIVGNSEMGRVHEKRTDYRPRLDAPGRMYGETDDSEN